MQSTLPERRAESLSYYHPTGPIGQVFASAAARVGAGRGRGGRPGGRIAGELRTAESQHWTFYEIDPAVERIARDARYFTYLGDCGDPLRGHDRRRTDVAGARAAAAVRAHHPGRVQLRRDPDPLADARGVGALSVAPGAGRGRRDAHLQSPPALAPVLGRLAVEAGLTVRVQREQRDSGVARGRQVPVGVGGPRANAAKISGPWHPMRGGCFPR